MMDDLQEYLNWYKDNNIYKSNYVLFGTFFKAFSESAIDRWFTGTLKSLMKHCLTVKLSHVLLSTS